MVPAMLASVDTMLERWAYHEGKESEMIKEFKILTSEVISMTAFGSTYLKGKNIFETLTKFGVLIARNSCNIRLFGLGKIWRSKEKIESDVIEQSLRDSIMSLIREKTMAEEADSFGKNFLGSLLKVHHDMDLKSRITVDDIVD